MASLEGQSETVLHICDFTAEGGRNLQKAASGLSQTIWMACITSHICISLSLVYQSP